MAASTFNRKKQFFAPEVGHLIKQLTNFEEDDQNFQEVEKFVYSNIIHHNFATVDIIKVQQTIDGYVEKFKAHGLNDRARRFRELVDKYVSSDTSHHTQLNVQWHVLWLLLNLSYNPTKVPEEALKVEEEPLESKESEEDINWGEYLREGLEDFQCPSVSSDEELWLSLSEGDDEEEEPLPPVIPQANEPVEELKGLGSIPHPSLWQPVPPPLTRQESLRRIVRDGVQAEHWLRNNVQHSWWSDPSCRSVIHSKHPEAHMSEIWEKCQQLKQVRHSPTALSTELQEISEFKVLQELLWMLQVPTNSGVFCLDDKDQFHVKSNISLPSTTPDTFISFLEGLCPYINMVYHLRRFEEALNEQEMSDNPPPVTYKAYCAALFTHLQKFTNIVINIESRLSKQDETMTLLSVSDELMPGLNILRYMYEIHVKAITDWLSQPAWLSATRLLSVLYEAVCEASDEMLLELSLDLFIHSFHPYLDIIDVWLSEGRLENWRKEFLVVREEEGGVLEVMPYEAEMRRCGVTPVSLLTRLVAVVREAGRTMEVVNDLNKLPEFRNTVHNKDITSMENAKKKLMNYEKIQEQYKHFNLECLTQEVQTDIDNNEMDKIVAVAATKATRRKEVTSSSAPTVHPENGTGGVQQHQGSKSYPQLKTPSETLLSTFYGESTSKAHAEYDFQRMELQAIPYESLPLQTTKDSDDESQQFTDLQRMEPQTTSSEPLPPQTSMVIDEESQQFTYLQRMEPQTTSSEPLPPQTSKDSDEESQQGCLFKEFSENVYNEIKRLRENTVANPQEEGINLDISVKSHSDDLPEESTELSVGTFKKEETQLETQNVISVKEVGFDSLPSSGDAGGGKSNRGNVPFYLMALSGKAMYERTMAVLLHNPLLGEVFADYLRPEQPLSPPQSTPQLPEAVSDYSVSLVGLMSIHSLLERQLELVESRHRTASALVTQTLRREHNLLQHFTVLRNVFFMENGNLAQRFYSYLFKEIEAGTWSNVISLNAQLKVCVEEYFSGFENFFTVQIDRKHITSHTVHHIIPAISLAYRVDWPVSLVITEDSIECYNKVFRFLLHLKYAYWTLHETRFCDLAASTHPLWQRRLHVLKSWMFHSTNTLHFYFMGLVLRSYSTHLEESIQSADSLQLIVQAHKRFLDEVKVHCLQDKKNYLESFIKKLLKLCSTLSDLWYMEATGTMTEDDLDSLEAGFLTSYRGLIHCLENVTPEEDVGNFLYELKCEIAASEPEHFTVEK